MNSETQLLTLKSKIKQLETVKIRTEEQIKHLKVQKEELTNELISSGIAVDSLDYYLQNLDVEIQQLIQNVTNSLPNIPKELL